MVTETVTINFVERGSRVVKRKIDDIGQAANKATRGIFLLQRAIFVLGGAGIVNGIIKMTDALTNMENKLRLTSRSTSNLEAVQDRLFASANRSRSAVEATASVYSRLALSTRGLGVSQQQVIDVTETLQKAAILSGAAAQEANAALVQLGQGLASDRLGGDELRSVLEQLPLVADLIVDYLNKTQQFGNVTRGSLRKLGTEGKLTADIVFRAIEQAKGGIDNLFSQTAPTIEQSFIVAKNNLISFIDAFDDATGASAKLASAIIVISENIDVLIRLLAALTVAFALSLGASAIKSLSLLAAGYTRAGAAVARYSAIQVASAGKQLASTTATLNDNRARLQNIQIRSVQVGATLRNAQAEYANAAAVFQGGSARSLATGQFINMQLARDRLTAATIRLTAAENANNIATGRSAALSAQTTATETAQAAARARLAGATATQGAFLTRLTAVFPLLTGVTLGATAAMSSFGAVLLANPITAVIGAVFLLVSAVAIFGDKIGVALNGMITLKDYFIAAWQLMYKAIAPFLGPVWQTLKSGLDSVVSALSSFAGFIGTVFMNVATSIINAFTFLPRVVVGVVFGIIAALRSLPGAAGDVAMGLANAMIEGFESWVNAAIIGINKVISALNSLVSFVGGQKAAEFFGFSGEIPEIRPANLGRFVTSVQGAGQIASDAFQDGFSSAFEGGKIENILGDANDAILTRAVANAQTRGADQRLKDLNDQREIDRTGTPAAPVVPPSQGGKGKGSDTKTFAEELAKILQMIELEKQYGLQKEINNQILQVEKTIKRELSATEKDQVATAIQLLEVSKAYGSILQEIRGPQEALQIGQQALNMLFQEGAINLENYNQKLRELQINSDKATNTIGGGFRAAIAGSIQSAGEFGEALGGVVVGAAGKAADAIVDFAKTGKLNIKAFFADLFAQLLKLAAQRLLLSFLGGFGGIAGGGLGGGKGGLGFATGGSILPTGPGSTDSQIVQFAKRPDERVDILTPGQQQAKKEGKGESGGTTVVQSPPVNIAAVLNPADLFGLFDSGGDTQIINLLQRNANTVKQIAQS